VSENDYPTLKKYGRDYFEIHLRNIINETYSVKYTTCNISIAFPEVEDKEVCLVTVTRDSKPIYTTITDRNGHKGEKFFVRSDNSSRELEKPSDVVEYVNYRFKDSLVFLDRRKYRVYSEKK
jgi:hypothetical protein